MPISAPEQAGDTGVHRVQHAARSRRRDPRLRQKTLRLRFRITLPRGCFDLHPSCPDPTIVQWAKLPCVAMQAMMV